MSDAIEPPGFRGSSGPQAGSMVFTFDIDLLIQPKAAGGFFAKEFQQKLAPISYLSGFSVEIAEKLVEGLVSDGPLLADIVGRVYLETIARRVERLGIEVKFHDVQISSGSSKIKGKLKATLIGGFAALGILYNAMERINTVADFLQEVAPQTYEELRETIRNDVIQTMEALDKVFDSTTTASVTHQPSPTDEPPAWIIFDNRRRS